MTKLSFALLLLLAAPSWGATGGGRGGFAAGPAPASSGGPSVRGGGGGRARHDPRHAPAMDPTRRVSEQDCSKPVDLSAGNLRCK